MENPSVSALEVIWRRQFCDLFCFVWPRLVSVWDKGYTAQTEKERGRTPHTYICFHPCCMTVLLYFLLLPGKGKSLPSCGGLADCLTCADEGVMGWAEHVWHWCIKPSGLSSALAQVIGVQDLPVGTLLTQLRVRPLPTGFSSTTAPKQPSVPSQIKRSEWPFKVTPSCPQKTRISFDLSWIY